MVGHMIGYDQESLENPLWAQKQIPPFVELYPLNGAAPLSSQVWSGSWETVVGPLMWTTPPHPLLPLLVPQVHLCPKWGHCGWLEVFSTPAVTAWPQPPPMPPDMVRQQAPTHFEQSRALATALSLPPVPAQASQSPGCS